MAPIISAHSPARVAQRVFAHFALTGRIRTRTPRPDGAATRRACATVNAGPGAKPRPRPVFRHKQERMLAPLWARSDNVGRFSRRVPTTRQHRSYGSNYGPKWPCLWSDAARWLCRVERASAGVAMSNSPRISNRSRRVGRSSGMNSAWSDSSRVVRSGIGAARSSPLAAPASVSRRTSWRWRQQSRNARKAGPRTRSPECSFDRRAEASPTATSRGRSPPHARTAWGSTTHHRHNYAERLQQQPGVLLACRRGCRCGCWR